MQQLHRILEMMIYPKIAIPIILIYLDQWQHHYKYIHLSMEHQT